MIVLVSGLPRSGTSLMMRMLAMGGIPPLSDGARGADSANPNGYYEYEPVKSTARDSSWIAHASGKAVKLVSPLLCDLPSGYTCHVVFMQRRLKEVVASQQRMLADAKHRLAETPPSDHGLVQALAAEVARARAWLALQPDFRVLYVNYNQLIEKPMPVLKALDAFLPCTLDIQAMRRIIDKNLYRQRSRA